MTKHEFIILKTKYKNMSIELYGRHKSDPNSEFIIVPTNTDHICACENYFIYSYGMLADECIGYNYNDYNDTWKFIDNERRNYNG